jgi:hypothetical protein
MFDERSRAGGLEFQVFIFQLALARQAAAEWPPSMRAHTSPYRGTEPPKPPKTRPNPACPYARASVAMDSSDPMGATGAIHLHDRPKNTSRAGCSARVRAIRRCSIPKANCYPRPASTQSRDVDRK